MSIPVIFQHPPWYLDAVGCDDVSVMSTCLENPPLSSDLPFESSPLDSVLSTSHARRGAELP